MAQGTLGIAVVAGLLIAGAGCGDVSQRPNGAAGSAGAGSFDPACVVCPAADYGVTVRGDGEDFRILYTAPMGSGSLDCAEQPIRGRRVCDTFLNVSACTGSNGTERPCLFVDGRSARYTDRATGLLWRGTAMPVTWRDSAAGTIAGSVTLSLDAEGMTRILELDFVLCADENLFTSC